MAKKSEMIGFKTTPEIKKELERIAESEDRTISYIINRILQNHLFDKQIQSQSELNSSNVEGCAGGECEQR